MSGGLRRATWANQGAVRLVLANFDNDALLRELMSLEAHLKAGLPVAAALDVDRAWAAWCRTAPGPSASALWLCSGNEWSRMGGPSSLPSGSVVCLASMPPTPWREWLVTSAASTTLRLQLEDEVRYQHGPDAVLVREADFWPLLRLPEGGEAELLTHQFRRTWTWQVTLYEDVEGLAGLYAAGPRVLGDLDLPLDLARRRTPTALLASRWGSRRGAGTPDGRS
jgi:hypothetical protein